jgi:hypothetical protein
MVLLIFLLILVNAGLIYGFVKLIPTRPFLFWLDPKAARFFIDDVFKNQEEWGFETYSGNRGFHNDRNDGKIKFDFEKGYTGRISFPNSEVHRTSDIFSYGIRKYFHKQYSQKSMWDYYEEVKLKRINELLKTLDSQSEEEFYNSIKSKTKVA